VSLRPNSLLSSPTDENSSLAVLKDSVLETGYRKVKECRCTLNVSRVRGGLGSGVGGDLWFTGVASDGPLVKYAAVVPSMKEGEFRSLLVAFSCEFVEGGVGGRPESCELAVAIRTNSLYSSVRTTSPFNPRLPQFGISTVACARSGLRTSS
jgi:hypothetical protein